MAMLLEFRTRNYKSFTSELCFSMTPASKQKALGYSILSMQGGSKTYKGLCSAVIYGPNASGKTNLIGAMETFRAIVLRGNIRNADVASVSTAACSLELVPNCNGKAEPTEFLIRFADGGIMTEYSVKANLGPFMSKNYHRKILEERLVVNEKLVFLRNDTLTVELPAAVRTHLNRGLKRKTPEMQEIAAGSLEDTELFLCNGFKSIFSKALTGKILSWFSNKFVVISHAEELRMARRLAGLKAHAVCTEKTLTEAAGEFGITANVLKYKACSKKGNEAILCSILDDHKELPADVFESHGTIRFISEFPLVIYALLNGATLIMDEFDASIHPMALMNIITVFHNDEVNKNNAQLVFNTHNPLFLNSSLFRRDEIKFVERNEETGNSEHYALSDFKTADGTGNGGDYMDNYFAGRYGAIRDIDFSPMLEKIMLQDKICQ